MGYGGGIGRHGRRGRYGGRCRSASLLAILTEFALVATVAEAATEKPWHRTDLNARESKLSRNAEKVSSERNLYTKTGVCLL